MTKVKQRKIKYPELRNKKWLEEQLKNHCASEICQSIGCNQQMLHYYLKKYSLLLIKRKLTPKHIIDLRMEKDKGKHFCQCRKCIKKGRCKETEIKILRKYYKPSEGIPKYLPFHYSPPFGKDSPSWKDGRTLRKYYCKDCGKQISKMTAIYGGKGRCVRCVWTKEFRKKRILLFQSYTCKVCDNPRIKIDGRVPRGAPRFCKKHLDSYNRLKSFLFSRGQSPTNIPLEAIELNAEIYQLKTKIKKEVKKWG